MEKKVGGSRGVSIAALGGGAQQSATECNVHCDGLSCTLATKAPLEIKNRGDLSFLSFQPLFSHPPPRALGALIFATKRTAFEPHRE